MIVMHGGDNGELPAYYIDSQPNKGVWDIENPSYIFESTYDEIQANHKKSKYFLAPPSRRDESSLIPLLDDLFNLVSDRQKCP